MLDSMGRRYGLYIHVPFCVRKCAYCDFPSFDGLEWLQARYVAALLAELESWRRVGDAEWDTIYVGGGTPTCLQISELEQVLQAASGMRGGEDREFTVEANPGRVSPAHLQRIVECGVNRVSLGVQSFDDGELRVLGRIHGAMDVDQAIRAARSAGISNLNLDLIYGLPGQLLASWLQSLERALSYAPEHLSLYALSLEEHTPLSASVARGELAAPDDDLAADMYLLAEDMLGQAGYQHYELSNWAVSTKTRCKHNLKYWHMEPYIGVGAAAHSFVGGRRWWNVCSPREYISRFEECSTRVHLESREAMLRPVLEGEDILPPESQMGDTMFLGLRTAEGVLSSDFRSRFGVSVYTAYGARIRSLVASGLLEDDGERLRLSRRGRLLGNRVFAEFVDAPDAPPVCDPNEGATESDCDSDALCRPVDERCGEVTQPLDRPGVQSRHRDGIGGEACVVIR